MPEAFIVDAVRTPVGKRKGPLGAIHSADLGAHVIQALVEKNKVDPSSVEDVIFGCIDTIGPQAGDIARTCWLAAGYPEGVPGPDRVPLLALLRATPLTEDQLKEVVRNLTDAGAGASADGEITRDEIAEFISDVTQHDAGPENVARVAAKLAAAGWPLAGMDDGSSL